ncbi:BZ3500_MvSof-1268-A1-R1_Chr2-2g04993 [Microbotryum saponariae]|uniref:Transcription initiation factor IIB n=1 Tax=Microbotryum saponariae TaxID=289078 RepID=A0A2X0K669_9BASI|nr:BZ3500_MvSof-1268-A1-R1_Chr2-2g04993 [Microbotryum saponariae]SDA00661.1 BZ3501_MvSof-1269-A2-R1_Chr2-2g04667 [Microbotryum saponariae]
MSMQAFALRADPNGPAAQQDFRQDLNVRLICPDCQDENVNLIEEMSSGDLVCGECGHVLGDRIVDTRSECRAGPKDHVLAWDRCGRSFADSEGDDPSRVGGPTDPLLDPVNQLSTIISFKDNNTGISRGLQIANTRVLKDSGGGRDLHVAFDQIQIMCEAISLPKTIVDTSKQLFKRIDDEKLLKGKSQDAIIAATIFIACRQARVPRTFKEIVALTNVSKKDIATCFKLLTQLFETVHANQAPPSSASATDSLITRYCNHLGLSVPVQRAAVFVGTRVGEEGLLAGRSPITIASACILFATTLWGIPEPAAKISAVAGVQDSTIRMGYRLLLPHKEKLVDERWFVSSRKDGTRADWANIRSAKVKEEGEDGEVTSPDHAAPVPVV